MKIDINGLSTKLEVLTSIKENIQDGDTDTAIDMVNQLIELEHDPNGLPLNFTDKYHDPNGLPLNFTDKYHEEEPA